MCHIGRVITSEMCSSLYFRRTWRSDTMAERVRRKGAQKSGTVYGWMTRVGRQAIYGATKAADLPLWWLTTVLLSTLSMKLSLRCTPFKVSLWMSDLLNTNKLTGQTVQSAHLQTVADISAQWSKRDAKTTFCLLSLESSWHTDYEQLKIPLWAKRIL